MNKNSFVIDAPGRFITRNGSQVLIREIRDKAKATCNCVGEIKINKRWVFNIWKDDGSHLFVGTSPHDIVAKVSDVG